MIFALPPILYSYYSMACENWGRAKKPYPRFWTNRGWKPKIHSFFYLFLYVSIPVLAPLNFGTCAAIHIVFHSSNDEKDLVLHQMAVLVVLSSALSRVLFAPSPSFFFCSFGQRGRRSRDEDPSPPPPPHFLVSTSPTLGERRNSGGGGKHSSMDRRQNMTSGLQQVRFPFGA